VSLPRAASTALLPLFLVSAGAVGYEIALTRYFAVAKWSEYGYWVISIVMVGFALSGVVLALFRDLFARNGAKLLAALPAAMVLAAAIGFHFTTTNPFNPLQLQNQATWLPQIGNIALYYACLLPFFFLAGVYVSLTFVLNAREIGRVYGYDLTGAGAGAAAALALMFVLHPFMLVPALLVPLAASAFFRKGRGAMLAAVLALVAGEALLLLDGQAEFNDFKAIYAPLHTPDAKVLAEIRSPRGDYLLLDDFTERVDTDVSNNASMLGYAGPPQTFGLYRDGNRIAAIAKPGAPDTRYAAAALGAAPYVLLPGARVLLAGASGGFRVAEALALKAARVDVVEPEPILREALQNGIGPSAPMPADPRVHIVAGGPIGAARDAAAGQYDLVDVSADFLDAAEANATAFTAEAIADYLRAVGPQGIVSIPVSIRDFPVYAVRMLATARAGLLQAGIADPAAHVVVYRSAWGVRILLSPAAWSEARLGALKKFADERSFDLSYYPGIDVEAAKANLYNDLPSVSFTSGEMETGGADDAIANEAEAVLAGRSTQSSEAFNLAPITLDRPFFYAVLRLSQLDVILKRLEILPQQEIGALVNLAVLAQAIVIAILVLLIPLLAPGRVRAERGTGLLRPIIYFPALGLGFLFLEIFLIEKVSFYLNDRISAFAIVLTGMLVFSGFGSMAAGRFAADPRRGVVLATVVMLAWTAVVLFGLEPAMLASLGLPWAVRAFLVLLVVAPVSAALGLPFPLGLTRAGTGGFLPWAWGLNGAFSVVATPLANLVAREAGFSRVLLAAAILYGTALICFPSIRKTR
jgi:spermidine synthase